MPPSPQDTIGHALTGGPAEPLEVGMGRTLPPSGMMTVPLLRPQTQGLVTPHTRGLPPPNCTTLAEGLVFTGNARLAGACSIGCSFEGNLGQAPGAQVSVVITETGRFKGDIAAQKISVMGHTEGLLDAGTGEVSLHDNAHVQGKVRYGRIVVNGADLNATLERVSPSGSKV